jgi:phage terminase small subunit
MENFLKLNGKSYTAANGREYNRPQIAIRNDARRELRGLLIQLGATSASRGHVEKIKSQEGFNRWSLNNKIT